MSMVDSFRRAENEYQVLKGQLASASISREQFEAALKSLMVQDAQGRYWMIGADSGKWYVYDGTNWSEGLPPQAAEAIASMPAEPAVSPVAPIAAKPNGRNWLPIVVAGCGLLLVCFVCVAAALALMSGSITDYFKSSVTGGTPVSGKSTPAMSKIITKVVMARNTSGDNFDPVGVTSVFTSDQQVFHAVVTIANAPANTRFRVIWLTSSNSKMGEYELTSAGSRNLDFTFKPTDARLPTGSYRVEVYLNGVLDRTVDFSVR